MWAHCYLENMTPLKLTLIFDVWYSSDRYQSPDHSRISILKFLKMTELWPNYAYSYMGIGSILGFILPLSPLL